jgi:NADH-ubiquinone oxidoreductase chain 2
MFSFIGLPPLLGFFGKQMVLSTALDNDKIILVLVGVITSVIGAVYYLTIIKTIYFDNSDYKKITTYANISLSNTYSVTLSIINLSIINFIFMPNEIINMCNLLSILTYTNSF